MGGGQWVGGDGCCVQGAGLGVQGIYGVGGLGVGGWGCGAPAGFGAQGDGRCPPPPPAPVPFLQDFPGGAEMEASRCAPREALEHAGCPPGAIVDPRGSLRVLRDTEGGDGRGQLRPHSVEMELRAGEGGGEGGGERDGGEMGRKGGDGDEGTVGRWEEMVMGEWGGREGEMGERGGT